MMRRLVKGARIVGSLLRSFGAAWLNWASEMDAMDHQEPGTSFAVRTMDDVRRVAASTKHYDDHGYRSDVEPPD